MTAKSFLIPKIEFCSLREKLRYVSNIFKIMYDCTLMHAESIYKMHNYVYK